MATPEKGPNDSEKKQLNINSKVFVPESSSDQLKSNESKTTIPDDFSHSASKVIESMDYNNRLKDSKLNNKELKEVIVKDLTTLIDKLLIEGCLKEKMAIDDKE